MSKLWLCCVLAGVMPLALLMQGAPLWASLTLLGVQVGGLLGVIFVGRRDLRRQRKALDDLYRNLGQR